MYNFNYQDPLEQSTQALQGLTDPYAPTTDFGRVSMGQAPAINSEELSEEGLAIQQQADAATTMNEANLSAAGDVGQAVRDNSAYAYTSQGASDSEALGEGMFAFGLAMLASASQPGTDFGASLAAGLGGGAKAFTGALNRNKRYENIAALEAKGFSQESIDAYIQSGDNKQLVKNPTTNYMKTKEMNGQLYEYDERDPSGTMKLAQTGPRQIKSSVDLGDRVEVHYTDGSSEVKSKGMSASERARASNDAKKASAGNKTKYKDVIVEWQDPETKQFQTQSVVMDENNPGVFFSIHGVPMKLPDNAKLTSEAQLEKRTSNRYKAQDEAINLGNTISATSMSVADIVGTDVNFYDVSRFLPYTDSSKDQERLTSAKSELMVNRYSNMSGVAGASAATEKQLIDSIPGPTASPETKANWANKYLAYNEQVLSATIRQQTERYGQADPSLTEALSQVKSQREQLTTSLGDYRAQQSEVKQAAPGVVRAPSHQGGQQTAYGAVAQQEAPKTYGSFDPSQVKFK